MAAPPLPHRHPGAQPFPVRESLQLAAHTVNVAAARRFVRNVLAPVDSDQLVTDLELVTSELVTNAIEHAVGDVVDVTVSCDDDLVTLSVTSRGNEHQVGPSAHWRIADPGSITGRGLGIVRSLADRIDVRHRDGELRIVVERTLPAASAGQASSVTRAARSDDRRTLPASSRNGSSTNSTERGSL